MLTTDVLEKENNADALSGSLATTISEEERQLSDSSDACSTYGEFQHSTLRSGTESVVGQEDSFAYFRHFRNPYNRIEDTHSALRHRG